MTPRAVVGGEPMRIRVVLVVGSAAPADRVVLHATGGVPPATYLAGASGHDVTLTLVAREAPAGSWEGDVVVLGEPTRRWALLAPRGTVQGVAATAAGNPLGRTLLSLSLLDPGRELWVRARNDQRFCTLVHGADLAVAVDDPALRTAWHLQRRGAVSGAYRGMLAAARVISLLR